MRSIVQGVAVEVGDFDGDGRAAVRIHVPGLEQFVFVKGLPNEDLQAWAQWVPRPVSIVLTDEPQVIVPVQNQQPAPLQQGWLPQPQQVTSAVHDLFAQATRPTPQPPPMLTPAGQGQWIPPALQTPQQQQRVMTHQPAGTLPGQVPPAPQGPGYPRRPGRIVG